MNDRLSDGLFDPADGEARNLEKMLVIADALMRHVEQNTGDRSAAFEQFRRAAMLEERVRQRTRDLEATLKLLNEANSAAERARRDLSQAIEAPQTTLEELLDAFVAWGVLIRGKEPESVVLAHPPEQFQVVDVLEVIRNPAAADLETPEPRTSPVSEILDRHDEALRSALGGMTLRALATEPASRPTVTDLAQRRAG